MEVTFLAFIGVAITGAVVLALLIWRGFRATSMPSAADTIRLASYSSRIPDTHEVKAVLCIESSDLVASGRGFAEGHGKTGCK